MNNAKYIIYKGGGGENSIGTNYFAKRAAGRTTARDTYF